MSCCDLTAYRSINVLEWYIKVPDELGGLYDFMLMAHSFDIAK